MFDSAAEKILRRVADNSPEFQKSLADYDTRKENAIGMLSQKIAEIDTRLGELEGERQRLDKRLSFLLDDDDVAIVQSFRSDYKRRFSALNDEEQELESKKSQLKLLLKHFKEAQEKVKHSWLEQVNKALGYLHKKDWVSLKSTYRQIFDKVVVHRLDEAKVRLQFVFNNLNSPLISGELRFCISVGQAGVAGFEPAHAGIKTQCLTAWLYPNSSTIVSDKEQAVILNPAQHLTAWLYPNSSTIVSDKEQAVILNPAQHLTAWLYPIQAPSLVTRSRL